MNKVLIVIFCLFTFVNVNAQTSQKDKNQQSIDDLWKRINTLETSGKMSASDLEAEMAKLKELVKLQQDSIDKLNAILSQIKNLVNGKPASNLNPNNIKGAVSVYYSVNETEADYKNNKALDSLVRVYNIRKSEKIIIHGHADNTGNSVVNEKLSKKRSQTLKNYLVNEKGISADKISIQWFGSDKPVNDHSDPAYIYLNRRVEVFIEK